MAGFVASGGIGSENRGAANIVLDAGAGDNRAAVVFIAYWDNGASRTFTITAGGVEAGAPVAQVGNANDGLILAYVIPGIPAGEITVSITPNQTLSEGFFLVSTWDSVPQASPVVDSAIIAGNTGPSITIPTMSVGANEVGVGALYYYVVGASNPVASDTAMGTPFTAGISHSTHQRGDGTLGWTGLGTGGGSMAVGIVLGHDDGAAEPDPPPTIVSVDDDNTITSAQAGAVIAGANFSSATVEIRQGAVVVEQTVTAQDDDEITFNVVFDLSPDPSLRFGAATLAVINDDEQEDTIGITIEPPSGNLYVDVGTPNSEADNRITAVPDIESGDQIEARGEGGGAAPAGLTLNADVTFSFSSGNTPAAFDVRVWDVSDATWGAWATQAIGAAVEGSVTEASAFGATFAPATTQRVTFTSGIEAASALSGQASTAGLMSSGIEAGETFSGRAVALGAIVEALEAGDTDAAAQAAVAALSAQVETDAQYAAIAQAAAAIQAGIAAGEAWASLAATEAGLVAGAELGASFTGDTQGAQSAALIAGTEAAGQFLGAVAAFALLQSGVSASDAFAAASSVSASVTSGTALGASFDPVTGDSTVLVDAMAVQSVFLAAASAVSGLSAEADFDDAYEAISVALSAIASGVILGATFFATSTADVSIVGAAASVRAIRRMGASVRVIRPRATIN